MHGRHSTHRACRKPIEVLPLPPSLAQAFASLDAEDRRRRRARPLNGTAFDALRTAQETP